MGGACKQSCAVLQGTYALNLARRMLTKLAVFPLRRCGSWPCICRRCRRSIADLLRHCGKFTIRCKSTPLKFARFAPSIILMQGFVIFVPCYQVFKNRRLEDDTRQIISEWEYRKKHGSIYDADAVNGGSRTSKLSSKTSSSSIRNPSNPELYTLGSLEKCLQLNPKPLLLFAALKDFSGENISFLTHIHEWKTNWASLTPTKSNRKGAAESSYHMSDKLYRQQFNLAVRIYSSFVSLQYSDFPINISSGHLKELDMLFADAAAKMTPVSAGSLSSPFFDFDVEKHPQVTGKETGLPDDLMPAPESAHYNQVQGLKLQGVDHLPDDVIVPAGFGPSSFAHAEASIRELVLTNTWPKFVNAGYASSMDKGELKKRVDGMSRALSGIWASTMQRFRARKQKRIQNTFQEHHQKSVSVRSSTDETHLV